MDVGTERRCLYAREFSRHCHFDGNHHRGLHADRRGLLRSRGYDSSAKESRCFNS